VDDIQQQKFDKWNRENFVAHRETKFPPSHPTEFLVKIFSSPRYTKHSRIVGPEDSVLDVGCGSGNNLRFFLEKGCRSFGVEINHEMVKLAKENLNRIGLCPDIRLGNNRSLPFEDESFDVLTSINTIHYEEGTESVLQAFKEFHRVLRPGGTLLIVSAGPQHEIRSNISSQGNREYIVNNYGFRSSDKFTFFDNQWDLRDLLSGYFQKCECGVITEAYPESTLNFIFAQVWKQ
jgi:ubiquinone/menaquinone biosynthesis C-methylase UbiE